MNTETNKATEINDAARALDAARAAYNDAVEAGRYMNIANAIRTTDAARLIRSKAETALYVAERAA